MLDPAEKLYTIDQSLYSPGNPVCGPSPGPFSPPLTNCGNKTQDQHFFSPKEDATSAPPGECGSEMYDLAHALLEAEATGSRSAVVREELRHLIRKKRRISGYQENGETGKSTDMETKNADEERRKRRRDSNRRAAVKCRERKKEADEQVKKNCAVLETENKNLKTKVDSLEKQLSDLRKEIDQHRRICQLVLQDASRAASSTDTHTDHCQPQMSSAGSSSTSSLPALEAVSSQVEPDPLAETSPEMSGIQVNDTGDKNHSEQVSFTGSIYSSAPSTDTVFHQADDISPANISSVEVPSVSCPELSPEYLSVCYSISDPLDRFPEQEVPEFELPVFNSEDLKTLLNL